MTFLLCFIIVMTQHGGGIDSSFGFGYRSGDVEQCELIIAEVFGVILEDMLVVFGIINEELVSMMDERFQPFGLI